MMAVLYLALQTSYVQNKIKIKVLEILSNKYEAEWAIDDIKFDFFDELHLEGILFRDQEGDTLLSAKSLHIDIGVLSLMQKSVHLDQVILSDAHIELYVLEDGVMNYQFLLDEKSTTKSNVDDDNLENSSGWNFGISVIDIPHSSIRYETLDMRMDHDHQEFKIDFSDLDLGNKRILISDIYLNKASTLLSISSQKESNDTDFIFPDIGWEIGVSDLGISDTDFSYQQGNRSHRATNLNLNILNVNIADKSIEADIKKIAAGYNDLIVFKNIEGNLQLIEDQLAIKNLEVLTNSDKLSVTTLEGGLNAMEWDISKLDLHISPTTIRDFYSFIPKGIYLNQEDILLATANEIHYSRTTIAASNLSITYGDIINTRLSLKTIYDHQGINSLETEISTLDARPLQLDLALEAFEWPDSLRHVDHIEMSGRITGDQKTLYLKDIILQADHLGNLSFGGKIKHWRKPNDIAYNLTIKSLSSTAESIPIAKVSSLAFDSLKNISFAGSLEGTLMNSKIIGSLETTLGTMDLDAYFQNLDKLDSLQYRGKVVLKQFDIGTFLKNKELDKVSLNLMAIGKGISLATIDASLNGEVTQFSYKDYLYDDLSIAADINQNKIDGQLSIKDEHIDLNYDGIIDLSNGGILLDFESQVNHFRPQALDLYSTDLNISGSIKSKLRFPFNEGQKGNFTIRNLLLNNATDTVTVDSFLIKAYKERDSTYVNISSDFMNAQVDGLFDIRELPAAFASMLDMDNFGKIGDSEVNSRYLNIEADINNLRPLDIILGRDVLLLDNAKISSSIDFSSKDIDGDISIDSLFYDQFFAEKITITIDQKEGAYFLNIDADNNSYAGNDIPIIDINNVYRDNILDSRFIAKDKDALPRIKFATLYSKQDSFHSIALQDSLVLNRKEWMAQAGNQIKIYPFKFIVDNLEITDQNEFLKVQSTDDTGDQLAINFNNFNIGQFSTLVTGEPSDFKGDINGDFTIKGLNTEVYYTTNIIIDDLEYKENKVGAINLQARDNPQTNLLTADISLVGPNNDLNVNGSYNIESRIFDFSLDINKVELQLLDPFMSDFMTDSKGSVNGEASLTGSPEKPILDGYLNLQDVFTTIVVNKSRYGIENHRIKFNNKSITLGELPITDNQGNKALVSGRIDHNYLSDMTLDLKLFTDKFTFLNTKKTDNDIFYGKLKLKAAADITGPISLLDVNIRASTLDSSAISISPFSAEKYLQQESFVKYGTPEIDEGKNQESLLKLAQQYPFKVNLILSATDKVDVNFIVDPVTGDNIKIKGDGDLRVVLSPDGQQEIYGLYTVSEGNYFFSYGDFVKRTFAISPGSTLRFNGDPLNAVLDIDAVYSVNTTTYELIKNEVAFDESEISASKERTNVNVILSLSGTISAPEINLDIKIPDQESTSVASLMNLKLNELRNDPNELNNQVFGLLIFNSFIVQDNTTSSFSSVGSGIAYSSLSNLVSGQLNKLAGKALKGVDVNVNVNSYESEYIDNGNGGNITEIGVQLKKQLFNDRLSISAVGNVDISNSDESSYAGFLGDFIVEYKLTEDGTYRLKVFSKSDYDQLLNENTNRNGVSIFFNKSFDSKKDD